MHCVIYPCTPHTGVQRSGEKLCSFTTAVLNCFYGHFHAAATLFLGEGPTETNVSEAEWARQQFCALWWKNKFLISTWNWSMHNSYVAQPIDQLLYWLQLLAPSYLQWLVKHL